MSDQNPLLESWTTPFELPPFQAIEDRHFMPAFREAMERHNEAIDAIAGNTQSPTFENTVVALETAEQELNKVNAVFWNLCSADTNDARQEIEREIAPLSSQHWTAIFTSKPLFARIDALFHRVAELGLNQEQTELLERYHRNFVRSGAQLSGDGIARVKWINSRLADLYTKFSQNILAEEKGFQLVLDGEGDLTGLPDYVRQNAAQSAADRGMPGKHVITLARSSVEPFLQYSSRRDLREKAYRAYIARGEMNAKTDTRPLIREILQLRTERAKLLGFETYAAFRLDDTMAKTPAHARGLLENVWPHARHKAEGEREALQALAQSEGHNDKIAAWDWHYYTEKRRHSEFAIDGAALKQYFQLDNMIEACFDTATRLFGVTFEERKGLPVYHPDVRVWEAKDRSGTTVGLFLGDYYNRPSKQSGAWMSNYRKQFNIDGAVLPVIVNVMNFNKPAHGEPALLSLDDARTLFHEFGHGLHGLLSKVTYPSLSGTSVDRDFVELPSQLYENWLLQPETLSRYALHAKTGEAIPSELVEKVIAAQKFNQGFATAEYTASALFDLDAHEANLDRGLDVDAFEAAMRKRIGMPDEIALRHRPAHFQHIFTNEGYAAGYYTYLWAEVMEADAFAAFEETGDIFNPEVAARLYDNVYSAGAKVKAEEAYHNFRGKKPSVEALMKKRGLIDAEAA